MSIASWTSPPASALTFPISRVIRSDSSGLERSRTCAKRKRMLPRSGAGTRRQSSQAARAVPTEPCDVRDDPAALVHVRVPVAEGRLELARIVAAALEPDRVVRLRRHAVLVPRDVPRNGDDHLSVHPGEHDDRDARHAEGLPDPG